MIAGGILVGLAILGVVLVGELSDGIDTLRMLRESLSDARDWWRDRTGRKDKTERSD